MAHTAFQEAVKTFFKKPTNVAQACLDFREHHQGQSETASEFVSALRELAPDCYFLVDYLKRELALQILSGCHSTKARERVLLTAINLDEYVNIRESDESLQDDSRVFAAAASNGRPSTVHRVCTLRNQQQKGNANKGMQPNTNFRAGKCYACGQAGHLAKGSCCPTKDAKCKFCNKVGPWK